MSSHHDDHLSTEQKPVAFTVPFILAAVTILAVVLFLSLCDPKPHHGGEEGNGHEAVGMASGHHETSAEERHNDASAEKATEKEDSMTVESTVPSAEPGKEHH
jgi:hypothetical protein